MTINSLSGGKSSSYMAIHYPADYEVFALVCNDDPKCGHPDKKLMQMANDKLQKYTPQFGEFIGTPEHISILKTMFDLEQILGREIIWLRSISFDQAIKNKKAIPNQNTRWCTTLLKLDPMFWFWYLYIGEQVTMQIGFRWDEKQRAERFSKDYSIPVFCNNYGTKRQSWKEFKDWRIGSFPLIEEKANNWKVAKYFRNKPIQFAPDSNCQHCFWKHELQLRQNYEESPQVINWAESMELSQNQRFRFAMNMTQIKQIGLQTGLFGVGLYCNEGNCTD